MTPVAGRCLVTYTHSQGTVAAVTRSLSHQASNTSLKQIRYLTLDCLVDDHIWVKGGQGGLYILFRSVVSGHILPLLPNALRIPSLPNASGVSVSRRQKLDVVVLERQASSLCIRLYLV